MRVFPPIVLLVLLFCAGCAVQTGVPVTTSTDASSRASAGAEPFSQAPATRPGLGTAYGETRASQVSGTTFQRANGNVPAAVAALYYDDEEGARALAGGRSTESPADGARAEVGGGVVTLNARAPFRGRLPLIFARGRTYAIGKKGQRYTLSVHNALAYQVEAVLSVDGLDVIDGRAASYRKRGYILEPGETLSVEGFRKSQSEVAAFRFSDVPASYAALRHRETGNVGVIGMAIFERAGANPYTPGEVRRRRDADPFPDSRFATPPGR